MNSLNLELKYGSPRHKKVLDAVYRRYRMSKQKMTDLQKQWKEAENNFLCYIPTREADALRSSKRDDGMPQYTTLVIPYSYAILMTAHTYWTSVFLSRNPVHQYQAVHGLGSGNEQALEAIINYQVTVGKQMPIYYIWFLDVGKYGLGIVGNYWDDEVQTVSQIQETPDLFMGMIPTGKTTKKKITQQIPGYSGNKLFNVRPYHFFPDPRLPLSRFQEGEFCGRYVEIPWNRLAEKELADEYFNLDYLSGDKTGMGGGPFMVVDDSPGNIAPEPNLTYGIGSDGLQTKGMNAFIEMFIELIPADWGFGTSKYPEKWVFTMKETGDVLIGARPLGAIHNQYPYSLLHLEPEGYQLSSRGIMQIAKPLQDTMDWLVNSHFYNVRKVLNDQFIIDPSRVVMKDVLDPLPGGIWRLKPSAYGTDPKTVVTQVPVIDVTSQNMKDVEIVASMIQRALGVNDNLMGLVNDGGRKTATEVRSSNTLGANRLKTQTEYFSATGFSQLSQMMVQNTQQNYDQTKLFRLAGDLVSGQPGQNPYISVDPASIAGFWDFVPVDGTLPVDRYAQANLWREMFQEMAQIPVLASQYDLPGIFAWVAQLAGLKNIGKFRIQLASPQSIQNAIATGQGTPPGAMADGSTGGTPGGVGGVLEPGQIPGMGQTS